MTGRNDPEMQISRKGIRESSEVDLTCALQIVTFRLTDSAGELGSADAAYALRLEGYGAGN